MVADLRPSTRARDAQYSSAGSVSTYRRNATSTWPPERSDTRTRCIAAADPPGISATPVTPVASSSSQTQASVSAEGAADRNIDARCPSSTNPVCPHPPALENPSRSLARGRTYRA